MMMMVEYHLSHVSIEFTSAYKQGKYLEGSLEGTSSDELSAQFHGEKV